MSLLRRTLGIFVLAVFFTAGCTNTGKLPGGKGKIALPPITENPTGRIYPGKIVWHDLVTPSPQEAGKFYEQLFGWQIDYQGQYAVVRNGDKLIAGILKVDPSDGITRDGVWLPSVSVADVDTAAGLVKANGGRILKGPADMDQRGRGVLISDSLQANLVLLRAEGGDPADEEAAIGDWLWDEVWTTDPDSTEGFYKSVVGYDQALSNRQYSVFMHEGTWRAGMRHLEKNKEQMLWVPVVRVADPGETMNRAKELGGVVWVTPDKAPGIGDTALISDPTGAMLLIQRWPSKVSGGER